MKPGARTRRDLIASEFSFFRSPFERSFFCHFVLIFSEHVLLFPEALGGIKAQSSTLPHSIWCVCVCARLSVFKLETSPLRAHTLSHTHTHTHTHTHAHRN